MKKQLNDLHYLLTTVSPKLENHLKKMDSSNMYFCFRWLLVLFKREFVYSDIMRLWEVLWTDIPCANFHLLICVAILDNEKDTIINENYGLTEILKVSIFIQFCLPCYCSNGLLIFCNFVTSARKQFM